MALTANTKQCLAGLMDETMAGTTDEVPPETASETPTGHGFYTYLLECADGTLYCGWTTDPEQRLATHNSGKGAKYTRVRLPVKLVAQWQFDSKAEAMRFEYRLKRLSRQQKLALVQCQLPR